MSGHSISILTPAQAQARRGALVELLVDAVDAGASVNFVWPMSRAKAERWWDAALAGHARGDRVLIAAERDGRLDGSVQLVPAAPENQAFRADLSKMLVHRRARRQGLGTALLQAAEGEARRLGRTLLTLDTESASAAARLYARNGWVKFGDVPGYATSADGTRRDAVSFFYKAL